MGNLKIDALVHAYLAEERSIILLVLIYLILWRKLPSAKSAGRVQSVCLRLM